MAASLGDGVHYKIYPLLFTVPYYVGSPLGRCFAGCLPVEAKAFAGDSYVHMTYDGVLGRPVNAVILSQVIYIFQCAAGIFFLAQCGP